MGDLAKQAQILSAEIAASIVREQGGNSIQIQEAAESATIAAAASYPATLAATNGVTDNKIDAEIASFTATVTASSISGVNTVNAPSTLVSSKTVYFNGTENPSNSLPPKNFKYYWSNYPELFPEFPIVYYKFDENGNIIKDYNATIANVLKLLDEYYAKGYRIFIGFNSTEIKSILSWFQAHPDTKGISLFSSDDSLSVPKNIYRLQPPDSSILNSLTFKLDKARTIYYFYLKNSVYGTSILKELELKYGNKLKSFVVNSPSQDNLTEENLKKFYTGATSEDISLVYIGTIKNYLDLFNSTTFPMVTPTYGINVGSNNVTVNDSPTGITVESANAIAGKYHYLDFISLDTSPLFRKALEDLTVSNFVSSVPNCLLMVNYLARDLNILSIPAYNSILEFNENNDLKYYTVSNFLFVKDPNINSFSYIIESLTSFVPIYGNVESIVQNKFV
jgi:hypothetical protein